MENAISTNNLTKVYKGFALGPVNIEIPKGYITGIIGRNGAGKSTLIESVTGTISLSGGSAEILGMPLCGNEPRIKERLGIALGGGRFYDGVTVRNMTKLIKRFYKSWDDTTFERYIRQFGIDTDKKIKELSTGLREKYNIALALSHNADIIVMDEPSSGLDPIARGELMDIFAEVIEDENKTIVLSTHITSDLDRIADYIIMIEDGKVLFSMAKDELLDTHRIVKGGVQDLTDEVKASLIACKVGGHGFSGLTANAGKLGGGLLLEKPSVEDIMRFYVMNTEVR